MSISLDRGTEHHVSNSSLVSIGGELPYYLELRTGKLLDLLLSLGNRKGTERRKKARKWLYSRSRPGFYFKFDENLHLAYADQRDGHGTQHWWRLFFNQQYQQRIEDITKGSALAVGTKAPTNDRSGAGHNADREWGGMYFRSSAEIAIAEELDKKNVLFFGNVRGRLNDKDLPVTKASETMSGRVEVDFLVFKNRKCMVLEVDGNHHQEGTQTIRDYARDRVLLREGIPTARFTASECFNKAAEVVTEFLALF